MREIAINHLVWDALHFVWVAIPESPLRPSYGYPTNKAHVDLRYHPNSGEEMIQRIHHQRPQHSGYDSRYDEIHHPSSVRTRDSRLLANLADITLDIWFCNICKILYYKPLSHIAKMAGQN
jgi:hypothetical protein